MLNKKIYVTRKLPESIILKLKEQQLDVRMWEHEDIPVPSGVLQKEIVDIDGLFSLLTENIDEALLSQAKKLKVISNMAVGYNNIDIDAATKRGIMVTNTPGVLTETTADLTFALLLATARRLIESADYVRNGNWTTWSPMLMTGQDVYGATLGVIGLGRIGESLIKRAKGFGMEILYHSRTRKISKEEELRIVYVELEELLKRSDFVCVMVPYTPETVHLIDREQLALMKETAVLINTARGGIVNETALYEALKNGEIWAAGLDVFEEEPPSIDHPLFTLPNVIALPHIGSASIQTRMKMAELAVENIRQVFNDEIPSSLVNQVVRKG